MFLIGGDGVRCTRVKDSGDGIGTSPNTLLNRLPFQARFWPEG